MENKLMSFENVCTLLALVLIFKFCMAYPEVVIIAAIIIRPQFLSEMVFLTKEAIIKLREAIKGFGARAASVKNDVSTESKDKTDDGGYSPSDI